VGNIPHRVLDSAAYLAELTTDNGHDQGNHRNQQQQNGRQANIDAELSRKADMTALVAACATCSLL
jgi:hypothetical protein